MNDQKWINGHIMWEYSRDPHCLRGHYVDKRGRTYAWNYDLPLSTNLKTMTTSGNLRCYGGLIYTK